jgi:hypothetical protein
MTNSVRKTDQNVPEHFSDILCYKELTFYISFYTASQFPLVFSNIQFHPDHKLLCVHVYCHLSHELHPFVAEEASLLHSLNRKVSQFTTSNNAQAPRA